METSQRIRLASLRPRRGRELAEPPRNFSLAQLPRDADSIISSLVPLRPATALSLRPPAALHELTHRAHAHNEGSKALSDRIILSDEEVQTLLEQSTGPRVTLEGIKDKIKRVTFYMHDELTICVADMYDDFHITGTSCPVAKENFNADLGKHYAFADCIRQAWQLEGRLLKHQLYLEQTGTGAGK